MSNNEESYGAVVATLLVEWLLLTPETRSSKPVTGNILFRINFQLYRKDENKHKEARIGHISKHGRKVTY